MRSESTTKESDTDVRRDVNTAPPVRPFYELPTAVTPVTATDVAIGLANHALGRGRREFVEDVLAYLDADSAATYSSYRRALGDALRALDETTNERRRTVLLPAFCSSDFVDAIEGVGLDVRRYDVDPNTLAADLDSLRGTRADDALAVVAVNVLGYGSNLRSIQSFCHANGAYLVEALGYALGASYDGKRLGTYGDVSVLNFQQGKPIPVGGGMAVSRHPAVHFSDDDRELAPPNVAALAGYAAVSRPRAYYWYDRLEDELGRNSNGDAMSTHPESKTNFAYDDDFRTMSNFQGAVARRVLDRLSETQSVRADTAAFYARELGGIAHVEPIRPLDGVDDHQWVRYPVLASSNELRNEICRTLESNDVQVSLLYNWPKIDADAFPGARDLQRRIVPLPTHPYVDELDRRRIVELIRHVCEAFDRRLR